MGAGRGGGGLGYRAAQLDGVRKTAEPCCVLSDDAWGSSVHRLPQFIKLFHAFWFSRSSHIVQSVQAGDLGRRVSVVTTNHSETYGCKPSTLLLGRAHWDSCFVICGVSAGSSEWLGAGIIQRLLRLPVWCL